MFIPKLGAAASTAHASPQTKLIGNFKSSTLGLGTLSARRDAADLIVSVRFQQPVESALGAISTAPKLAADLVLTLSAPGTTNPNIEPGHSVSTRVRATGSSVDVRFNAAELASAATGTSGIGSLELAVHTIVGDPLRPLSMEFHGGKVDFAEPNSHTSSRTGTYYVDAELFR